jgi:hypothetical protein
MSRVILQSGLLAAVDAVREYLDDHEVGATVDVGWKRVYRQENQSPETGAGRVVFVPSGEGGSGGRVLPPRFVGPRGVANTDCGPNPGRVEHTVRALVDWERSIQIYIWAVDTSALEDERAQIEAAETLCEWVMRAVHAAPGAFASVTWGDTQWVRATERERSYGLELRVGLTFRHPIFDAPRDIIYPTRSAVARGGLHITPQPPVVGGDTPSTPRTA